MLYSHLHQTQFVIYGLTRLTGYILYFRSCHLQERRMWISTEISLILNNMPQQNHMYSRGTSGCFTRQEIIPNIPNTPINRPANSRFWPGPEFDRPSITETDNYQYIFNKGTSAERNIRMIRTGRLPHAAT